MMQLIIGLIGGTALLMYGVEMMGDSLERVSGPVMKKVLSALTGRVWKATVAGGVLTALVQSSTAITVLAVGFVNAGLINLKNAVGIIYGANIGTTITAQFMAQYYTFKLTDIALLVVGLGFAVQFLAKRRRAKDIGSALMGFGLMFLGLKILNEGVPFIKDNASVRYFFEHYANQPFIAVILGMLATMLVHSSSATIGISMVLAQAGLIDLNGAIGLMLGDNIGTCITAQMASIGANISARRTAWAHTIYNVIGVLLAMAIFAIFRGLIQMTSTDIGQQIANSHTIFNVLSAVVFLPFTGLYVRFLEWIVPDRGKEKATGKTKHLDPRFLETPVVAIDATIREIKEAADITRGMIQKAFKGFINEDPDILDQVTKDEDQINALQEQVTKYLIDLSKKDIGADVSSKIPALVHSINDIERIGDHAENLVELAREKMSKHLVFSDQAIAELNELNNEIELMFFETMAALDHNDPEQAVLIMKREERIDNFTDDLRASHIDRLERGFCLLQSGVIFLDIISNIERVADHMNNIAEAITNDLQ
ncbi:MAG TPA: sodium:solute symporter [Firmicutes bacterium]|jgi:phosphate:Na+ symporter|nr:sodium:solute symporter [Bacillota bacterium]HBR24661.1 sodium:solute symporter [Bacillota bacterium]HCF91707.1 sodium:solute symporter [Bacillota bacterium]